MQAEFLREPGRLQANNQAPDYSIVGYPGGIQWAGLLTIIFTKQPHQDSERGSYLLLDVEN